MKKTRKIKKFLTKFKRYKKNYKKFFNRDVLCLLVLATIIFFGGWARFYRLSENVHFYNDEAAHLTTMYEQMYHDKVFPLTGPAASGDNALYHGAFYYYLFVPAVVYGHGSPLAPAVFEILLGTVTIGLLYFSFKDQFGRKSALLISFFYAFSQLAVQYSRWAWNPNVIPFFLALAIFSLAKASEQKPRFLILFFLSLGAISQLHIGSLFLPLIGVVLLPYLLTISRDKKIWLWSIGAFITPIIPTIINEIVHGGVITRQLAQSFSQTDSSVSFWQKVINGYLFSEKISLQFFRLDYALYLGLVIGGLFVLLYALKNIKNPRLAILPSFIILVSAYTILSLGFFNGVLFTHYGEHLFVILPILAGIAVGSLWKDWRASAIIVLFAYFFFTNNLDWYNKIIASSNEYASQKKICESIRAMGFSQANVYVNDEYNPKNVAYTCKYYYSVTIGAGPTYYVHTDYQHNFKIEK